MRISSPLAALILAAALLAGCGESDVKRSVDAQAEALRFYGPDTPLIALVGTPVEAGISRQALASLNALPPWGPLVQQTERRLQRAGVPPARLGRLIRGSETVEGLPGTRMTVQLARPEESLTVLVTNTPEEMDALFHRAVLEGKLRPAGELDDARLFHGSGGAFAVRDGVMLTAASIARLRTAIETRDGDRSDQLDDRNAQDVLEEVPERAPLQLYAQPPASRQPPVHDAAFAVSGTPNGLRIDAFARLSDQGTHTALPAWRLVTRAPTRQTYARVDGDEIRATLRLVR